jgi:DNA-binding NtrC family response regulator
MKPDDKKESLILIIEDDQLVAETLRRFLERRGRGVLHATSAELGIDVLKKVKVNAVLLDNGLPGRMGLTALPAIKAITPAPVVVMTGHADEETDQDAKLLGANAMLAKPLDLDSLDKLLDELIK